MAVETLDVQELLLSNFQPKTQHRWILSIEGIDAFTLRGAARPSWTYDEVVIDYLNIKRYFSGKITFNPITVTLNDPIAPSAAQKCLEWVRLNHEPESGRSGYKKMYCKDITLKMLDPVGAVVEQWSLKNAWVQSLDAGTLDMSVSDVVTITLTLRYDFCSLEF